MQSANPRSGRANTALIVLLLLTTLLYARTLTFGFVYDDFSQIIGNSRIQSWHYLPSYFTQHLWAHNIPAANGNYYRPMLLVWMLLNYSLFGGAAMGWHVTSLLLQLAAGVLVFRTVRALGGSETEQTIATAIFLLHPLAIESTVWASDANDPLCLILLLGSMLALINRNGRSRWMRTGLSVWLFALAMLTKESAVAFVGVIFVYALLFRDDSVRGRRAVNALVATAPFVAVAGAYLILRHLVLGATILRANAQISAATALKSVPAVLAVYLKNLLLPTRLSILYDTPYVTSVYSREFWVPMLVVVAATAIIAWTWYRTRSRLFLLGVAWAFILLVPSLAAIPYFRGLGLVHDRYLYASMPGLALAVAVVIGLALTRHRMATAFVGAGLATMTMLTFLQQGAWQNNEALFTRATEVSPGNSTGWQLLGAVRLGQNRLREAKGAAQRALALDTNDFAANILTAEIALAEGDLQESERSVDRAMAIRPDRVEPHELLARVRFRQSRDLEGMAELQKSLEIFPTSPELRLQLASAHIKRGELREALSQYKAVLQMAPEDKDGLRQSIALLEWRIAQKR